jgi:tRNA A-37 threonylcarbamoyl transferase component Bud32
LKAIHTAGVYHGDLRYENLVVNASGEVAIIDFDRAMINARESDKKAELRVLRRLLESRVDDSALEEAKAEGSRGSRAQKGKRGDEGPIPGRVTRSMGTARETLSGMRLRPRR